MKILIIVTTIVVSIYIIFRLLLRKGKKTENALTWFYQSLEMLYFKDQPNGDVDEHKLLTAAAFFYLKGKSLNKINIDLAELKTLAVYAESKYISSSYDSRLNSLVLFAILLTNAINIRSENPGASIEPENQDFVERMECLNKSKIAKTVQKNLANRTPPNMHFAISQNFVSSYPDWYNLKFN